MLVFSRTRSLLYQLSGTQIVGSSSAEKQFNLSVVYFKPFIKFMAIFFTVIIIMDMIS